MCSESAVLDISVCVDVCMCCGCAVTDLSLCECVSMF